MIGVHFTIAGVHVVGRGHLTMPLQATARGLPRLSASRSAYRRQAFNRDIGRAMGPQRATVAGKGGTHENEGTREAPID